MSDVSHRYPIRTVASLTGVHPMTLRAWERRYGLVEPSRTDGGHRLYSQSDIDRIRRIVGLITEGVPVGQVADVIESPSRDAAGSGQSAGAGLDTGPGAGTAWAQWREALLAGVASFDEARIDDLYQEMLSLHPADRVMHDALLPVLAALGERWARSPGAIAEEHFFAAFIRNKLGARLHHRSRSAAGPKLLMACLPGEHHDAGLLLFALAAHDRGYRIALLGADMPIEPLAGVARRAQADAIVLSGSVRVVDDALRDALAGLVAQSGMPVFVGGFSSQQSRDAVVSAGAVALGVELSTAMGLLERRLQAQASATDPQSKPPARA